MNFEEMGEHHWQNMSILDRKTLLEEFAKIVKRKPEQWEGKTFDDIAQIPSFDDLPSSLRGELIMTMTEKGFSFGEYKRTNDIIKNEFFGKGLK